MCGQVPAMGMTGQVPPGDSSPNPKSGPNARKGNGHEESHHMRGFKCAVLPPTRRAQGRPGHLAHPQKDQVMNTRIESLESRRLLSAGWTTVDDYHSVADA